MGKTVGRLVLVAAAVAVVAFAPQISAAIAATIGATAASAITTALVSTAIATGLNAGAGLLGLGPKAPPSQTTVTTVKQSIPPRVRGYGRRRLYGSKILFETNAQGATVDAYAFHDGQVDGYEQIYLNDDKVTVSGNTVQTLLDKRYQSGHVKVGFNLGLPTETAFAEVIARLPGIWTANHRGDGVATGYLVKEPEKEKYLLDTYPQGDNVELSAVFRMSLCFDPRTNATAWTQNPVLHTLDYLVNQRGYDYATRIVPTLQYWIDAANICDEAIPLKAGGSELRYRGCVVYDATRQPKEILASLLECFDGWLAPRGDGALVIYAGKLYVPTVTLGADEIIDFNLPYGVASENRVDQLSVSYVSDQHDYNTVETTPWGGIGIRSDAISPQVPSHAQARRLAKRSYSRVNEFNRGSLTTNLLGRKARGHRFINLLIEESGIVFFEGLAEITSVKRDFTAGGLAIEWVAIDENIDAWNPATEEGDPAALGDNVAPGPLDTPSISSLSAFPGETTAQINIDAGSYTRTDLTWYTRWKLSSDSAWSEQETLDTDPGDPVALSINIVPINASIDVQIAYGVGDGRISDWSATETVLTDAGEVEYDGGDADGNP